MALRRCTFLQSKFQYAEPLEFLKQFLLLKKKDSLGKNCLHFSICACYPCAGSMLIKIKMMSAETAEFHFIWRAWKWIQRVTWNGYIRCACKIVYTCRLTISFFQDENHMVRIRCVSVALEVLENPVGNRLEQNPWLRLEKKTLCQKKAHDKFHVG